MRSKRDRGEVVGMNVVVPIWKRVYKTLSTNMKTLHKDGKASNKTKNPEGK